MYSFLPHRISVAETDLMGILHHSNHINLLERGRIEFMRQIDISYAAISKNGSHFPVLDLGCQYRSPIHFDEIALIETHLSFISPSRMAFSYRILGGTGLSQIDLSPSPHATGKLLATASTEHCCVTEEGRPKRIPGNLLKIFAKYCVEDR